MTQIVFVDCCKLSTYQGKLISPLFFEYFIFALKTRTKNVGY